MKEGDYNHYGRSPAMAILPTIKLRNEIREIDIKIAELKRRRNELMAGWERDHPRPSWWRRWFLWSLLLILVACTELGTQKGRYESSRALWEAGDRLQTQGRDMMLESRFQMMNAAIIAPHH